MSHFSKHMFSLYELNQKNIIDFCGSERGNEPLFTCSMLFAKLTNIFSAH